MSADRSVWVHALTAHPPSTVIALARKLASDWTLSQGELPQSGLGMLKLVDGALHEAYFLGEFPLARCHLRIGLPDGREASGAAWVMGDDAELAEALAVLDAVLAGDLPGRHEALELVSAGLGLREAVERERHALLAATRVDFSLLGSAGEDA